MNKAKLSYYIKHSTGFKTIYVVLGSLALRLIGLFVVQDKKMILFVANIGKNFSGSPYAIYDYIRHNSKYREYRCIWAFNNPEQFDNESLETVRFDSLKYFITALRAKYWVTDVNIERSLKFKKKNTVYLNTWHGVTLKTIGNDDVNSGRYDYSNIDYLCVSGEHDKRVYRTALNAGEKSFLECGMPRNDSLFTTNESDREKIRNKLGITQGKKVILYAPTWRDSVNHGESFDLHIPADFSYWHEVLGDEYILFFRAHDRTTKLLDIQFNEFIRDYASYEPLNDLLIACDILITDYSSIVFDYSILKKPFICFGYDYEKYVRERGTYFDAEAVYPGGVLRTQEEVLNKILTLDATREAAKMDELSKKFMEYSHGNAAKICAERLLGDN